MGFTRIEDAVGKWVIVRFTCLPEELKDQVTDLGNAEDKWVQYQLQGVDHVGIWIQNPWFRLESRDKEAPQRKALVLVKWEYVASIVYLAGEQADDIPLGFKTPSQ